MGTMIRAARTVLLETALAFTSAVEDVLADALERADARPAPPPALGENVISFEERARESAMRRHPTSRGRRGPA